MNKRITEKRIKNRFRKVFANTLSWALEAKVPPSRISMDIIEENGEHKMVGNYHNYTMTVRLPHCAKFEEAADDQSGEN